MKSVLILLFSVLLFTGLQAQVNMAGKPALTRTEAFVDSLDKKSVNIYLFEPDSARAYAEEALILSKQLKYNRGQGLSYAAIGYAYWAQSYNSLSLYNLLNAVEHLSKTNELDQLSMCYRLIARNYMERAEYNLSAQYMRLAEATAIRSKDNNKILIVYNESSLLQLRQHNYGKAWQIATAAMYLAQKSNDTLLKGILYSRLGNILYETGKQNAAKYYFDSSLLWSYLGHNNRLRSYVLINYAHYFLERGQTDSAVAMAKAALVLADSIGNTDVKLQAAALTVDAYKHANSVLNELAARRFYNALQDSLRSDETNKSFKLLLQFITVNDRLQDIELQEQNSMSSWERLRFQHTIIIALVIFIVLLLAGMLTIYYLYNEKRRLAIQLEDRNNATNKQNAVIEEQSRNLEVLNNLKTKLFAIISHDLRAPIGNLRSIMGLFQQNELNEEQTVLLLKRMLPALDGADLTLSNLLNWSVKQMNGLQPTRTNFPVFQLADEIRKVFEFALEQKQIQFFNELPQSYRVFCDEHHLKIVLRNLISNAIKFTPRGGQITVGAHLLANKIIIQVKDTGQGISEADLAKLFVPTLYFTTRGTGGEKGTGLGLLLCKELLELNNGNMHIESVVGAGSSFIIELPTVES